MSYLTEDRARVPGGVHYIAGLILGISLLVYSTTAGGSLTTTDALVTYEVTKSLVHDRSIALPQGVTPREARIGADGRYYSPFGLAQSVYNIPFYLVGVTAQALSGIRIGKADTFTKATVGFGNVFLAGGAVWLTFLFAWRITRNVRASTLAALALGFGTLLWPYSKFGFNAPLATVCLLGGSYGMWVGTRTGKESFLTLGGISLACGLLTRHELGLAVIPAAVWLVLESGNQKVLARRAWRAGSPVVVAGAVWCVYNFVRFGNPLDAGYFGDNGMGFGGSMLSGLYGLLVTPGASLFVYSPITLVGLIALIRLGFLDTRTAIFFGSQILVFLVFYSTLENWFGGRSYGSRYLVPILPYLCIPLAPVFAQLQSFMARRVIIAVVLCSTATQLPGILVDYAKVSVAYTQSAGDAPLSLPERQYSWSAAPLPLNARVAAEAVPTNARYLLGFEAPPSIASPTQEGTSFSQQFTFSLDFWWLYLYYLGVASAPVAVALGLVPLGGAILLGKALKLSFDEASGSADPPGSAAVVNSRKQSTRP